MKKRTGSKNQKRRFSAVLSVKRNARTRVGQPKSSRVIPDKPLAREKYRPTFAQQLGSEE